MFLTSAKNKNKRVCSLDPEFMTDQRNEDDGGALAAALNGRSKGYFEAKLSNRKARRKLTHYPPLERQTREFREESQRYSGHH